MLEPYAKYQIGSGSRAGAYTDIALRDAINEGMLPGPRIIASGPALSITGGHCDQNLLPYEWHAKSDGAADGQQRLAVGA